MKNAKNAFTNLQTSGLVIFFLHTQFSSEWVSIFYLTSFYVVIYLLLW